MISFKRLRALLGVASLAIGTMATAQTQYVYKYVGPAFSGPGVPADHVEVVFTASAPLKPNTAYTNPTDAGVINASVYVKTAAGAVVRSFNALPSTGGNFQIRTDATASATTPGIESWAILGGANNLQGTSPTMTGTDIQAYTFNTLRSRPSSMQLATTAYDQGTETTFYATSNCNGTPNCQQAGNGQPYTTNYGGRTFVDSSAANWSITVANGGTTQPPTVANLALSGSLPAATVGSSYAASLTASGGTQPYTWIASGLPVGLSINSGSGLINGVPQVQGSYNLAITVKDSSNPQKTITANTVLVVNPAPITPSSCSRPTGTVNAQGKSLVTAVGSDHVVVGVVKVMVPACATVSWNGAKGFKIGQKVEYQGYHGASTGTVGTKISVN